MRVIVHGGAGPTPDAPEARADVLEAAADAATAADRPTDAVCVATRTLESHPAFNAGVGGAVQSDGYVRTDAGLMTSDREVGAACGMPGVEHAIDVARVVKEETPHVLVGGVHAVDLAEGFGVETGVDLRTDRTRERWNELESRPGGDARAQAEWVAEHFGADHWPDGHDTVGAVATDGERLAAATSTGGRWLALAGRIGDVPQVGSGFYCTETGAASATGHGEDIARVTLARRAVQFVEEGLDARAAADGALAEFDDLTDGSAGLVVVTLDGDVGKAHNAVTMQTAVDGRVD